MLFSNQIKRAKNVCIYWYLIFKTRYSKMLKQRYAGFYEEFENKQKKERKQFDLLELGFEPQIFSNCPIHDLNFHGR